ncbi:MAG: bifunctional diaminohydroxyphosphoribosylaminopyrimidine deaminase/5-amino-6-(5-phosphoribosylamino)uracil reductase RibD [Phascolarctobacterium sp.]|nr:bifunctional diaminohydroxyphosphoribosylaminopyrimidine deaminase/5-amino-6-(5-phosphoribosylamino)uracil reductase RibD [Phascolarctobacterium sp.]
MTDLDYMQRALALALEAEGNTSPNPMVGCVIVNADGEIVGEGYHHKAGEPHAEVNALAEAKQQAIGATAYVTLEPCAHYGRTGPCCVALAKAGIKKVVCACLDPNPKVAGKGVEYLRLQNIEVEVGLCQKEAERLNEKFLTWITKKRPFISMKYAMTLDGKLATQTRDSKWITGEAARTFAHQLRKQHDAILVGIGTVLSDDPELTTRLVRGKNPIRIVLDRDLKISPMAQVLNPAAQTIIFCGLEASKTKEENLTIFPNVEVVRVPSMGKQLILEYIIEELNKRQITSVLVEGGSEIHGAFRDEELVDRVYAFIAPKICGGRHALSPVAGSGIDEMQDAWNLEEIEIEKFGQDILITGLVPKKED